MTKIVAVVSQKGGVGKTSLTQNLGAELAQLGCRVLLVDFDPQSNLTTGWGFDPGEERPTIYTAMMQPKQAQKTILNVRPNLDLVSANLDLSGAELQFISAIDRNYKLRKALAPFVGSYDYILIDSPPSLGFFTINALVTATDIVIPLQCQAYAYKALDQLFQIVEQVKEINEKLRLAAIVLTMYDVRNSLTISVEEAARNRFGDLVMKATVPVNVRIAEAPLDGVSVGEYEMNSTGAQAYRALAKEMMSRG